MNRSRASGGSGRHGIPEGNHIPRRLALFYPTLQLTWLVATHPLLLSNPSTRRPSLVLFWFAWLLSQSQRKRSAGPKPPNI